MKLKLLLFTANLMVCAYARAQETIQLTDKLTPQVTLVYHVLKADPQVYQGLFQAFYKRKTPVASGSYERGKRTGTWHFFNKNGKLLEHFDYSHNTLLYEAPDDSAARFKYLVDDTLKKADQTTKPVKVGGRYFGYLPYLNLFKLPNNYSDYNDASTRVYLELLVSPAGRLADYRIHLILPQYGERILSVNTSQLSDDDKAFAPATINGADVACRIFILCFLNANGRLSL